MKTSWIWQAPTWPKFTYDRAAVAPVVSRALEAGQRLTGAASTVGFDIVDQLKLDVWAANAIATAAIEGEQLDMTRVRSSIARRLGMTGVPATRSVEGLLDVMADAAENPFADLTDDRLHRWHAQLFDGRFLIHDTEVGRYRSRPMEVVSGPIGKQIVHYEAPPPERMAAEMQAFIEWFNVRADDPVTRAGLAHVWFESIHPFDDGNGRIGRALIDVALVYPFHGMSAEIERRKEGYYRELANATKGSGDLTAWLTWFAETFEAACAASIKIINDSLERGRFWSKHSAVAINERQRKALNRLLEGPFEGGMTPRKYVSLTSTSSVTASRDLADLAEKEILVRVGGGHATRYELTKRSG
jgi:Fic family protein